MKLYLKAIGVSITVTKGFQGVFIVQRCPLVGRHLHRRSATEVLSGLGMRKR